MPGGGQRYRLLRLAGERRFTWLWLAEPIGGDRGPGEEQQQQQQQPATVVIKVGRPLAAAECTDEENCCNSAAAGVRTGAAATFAQSASAAAAAKQVSKDADVEGFAAACRERDMTAAAQQGQLQGRPQEAPPASGPAPSPPPGSLTVPLLGWFEAPGAGGSGKHGCMVLKLLGDSLAVAVDRYVCV